MTKKVKCVISKKVVCTKENCTYPNCSELQQDILKQLKSICDGKV